MLIGSSLAVDLVASLPRRGFGPPLGAGCASDFALVAGRGRFFFGDDATLLEVLEVLEDPELDDPELLVLLLELLSDDALLVDSARGFLLPLSSTIIRPLCCLFRSFAGFGAKPLVLCWDLEVADGFSFGSVFSDFGRSLEVPASSGADGVGPTFSALWSSFFAWRVPRNDNDAELCPVSGFPVSVFPSGVSLASPACMAVVIASWISRFSTDLEPSFFLDDFSPDSDADDFLDFDALLPSSLP